jgi:hypothetical protein
MKAVLPTGSTMRLLIAVLLLTLATPTIADQKLKSQKIQIDNKAIDSGMKESGQKADISRRTQPAKRLPNKDAREDRKIAR